MAVYTHVTDTELNAFLELYDVGTPLSFKGIAEGVENSNYLLRTTSGTFILTLYEKRVQEDDLPFFLSLMTHLNNREVTCPRAIAARDGRLYNELCGRPAALIEFLEGVGTALAELHIGAIGLEAERGNSLDLEALMDLSIKCRDRASEVDDRLVEVIDSELSKLSAIWPSHLPRGTIHGDLFPDNVLFLDHKVSGMIDFYFACDDVLAYDLAICLNAWCFDGENFNREKARAMLVAYSQMRPFSELELDALPLLCRGAALRFLLTRLHDWLFHPEGALVARKDPMEYFHKLQFHQSVQSRAEYGL